MRKGESVCHAEPPWPNATRKWAAALHRPRVSLFPANSAKNAATAESAAEIVVTAGATAEIAGATGAVEAIATAVVEIVALAAIAIAATVDHDPIAAPNAGPIDRSDRTGRQSELTPRSNGNASNRGSKPLSRAARISPNPRSRPERTGK